MSTPIAGHDRSRFEIFLNDFIHTQRTVCVCTSGNGFASESFGTLKKAPDGERDYIVEGSDQCSRVRFSIDVVTYIGQISIFIAA